MKSLLYLSHRIPYPPDKGDKIRSYNLIEELAKRYKVYLAAFVDDEADWQHTRELDSICEQTLFIRLRPAVSRLLSLRGLFFGSSLTLPYYESAELRSWVRSLATERVIDVGVAFSSSMAQYLDELDAMTIPSIIDFCDVDSDKWRQYGESKSWPASWIFAREGRALAREERRFHDRSQASVLISDDEADVFRSVLNTGAEKVFTVRNGVDTTFFDPELSFESPFQNAQPTAVFVGAMDYWPNVDAVKWFVDNVLPGVLAEHPRFRFYIVGSNPSESVKRLGKHSSVVVTGRVDDVRPFVASADCVVAPIRVARGVQNKVLEAMSMARPLMASSQALEGIGDVPGLSSVDEAPEWIDMLNAHFRSANHVVRNDYRDYVMQHFSWEASGAQLADLAKSLTKSP